MQFREQLKKKRKELEMTQQQIADRLGVTSASISSWENGSRNPSYEMLGRWAGLLGYSVCLIEEVVRACE